MNKYVKLGLFGIIIWVIPFIVSFLIFSLRESNRPLFESLMPVVLTFTVVLFSILYFYKTEKDYLKDGIVAGVIWLIISLVIDLILFLPESPMQMTITEYIMDIGLTYLIILIIPIGIGYILQRKT